MAIHSDRSIPGILTDLFNHFTVLLRQEGELARTEISEKISQTGASITMIVIGAVVLMPAMVILLEAAVVGLETTGLASYWSALAIGGGVFLIGVSVMAAGALRLRAKRMMPTKTIHQLQADASVAKRQVRRDNDFQRAA
jgi:protein-S-isoprenylcysteine O-methyltransferase Ste14